MDKDLSGNQGAVLVLSGSGELFDKLRWEGARLKAGAWHAYDAFNFVVTAWHLHADWAVSEPAGNLSRRKRDRRNLPPEMVLVIEVLRDLANGSKHFHLDSQGASRRKVDTVHSGDEVGWYEWAFHEEMPGVSVGQTYFSIRVLRNVLLRYFEWVLDEAVAVTDFPKEIVETVRYCDIPTRPLPCPPLWGID